MEAYMQISLLNDFIFCPLSIYYHQLYGGLSTRLYYDTPQINGKAVHETIDEQRYSTHKDVYQGMEIYSDEYKLCGKIDIYDSKKKLLTERKKHINIVYDGYVFQLYAQYYSLKEMGFCVEKIRFYSYDDNKIYPVKLPDEDIIMKNKFIDTIDKMHNFNIESFVPQNSEKCSHCIYSNFCDRAIL